ncbi:unnamed protein product, partial [marine sediment metagenome]
AFIGLIDTNMKLRFANEPLLKSIGRTKDEVIGKPVEDILAASTFSVSKPNLLRALQGEERVYENILTSADGTKLDVVVHLVPEVDSLGKTTGVCALLVDRSALKQAHEELRRKELRIQTAVEGSSVGIIEFSFDDPDWVFADHIESLLELEPGELKNSRKMIRNRIHPDDLKINDLAKTQEAQGHGTKIEIRLKTKSGDYCWFAINSRAIGGKMGTPQRVIGTISDIDDLKQAQLRATEDVRRRDEFLAMLSHELRNPMAA